MFQIEDLCNGSTPDSDSVCGGSNPSSSAKKRLTAFAVGRFFALEGFEPIQMRMSGGHPRPPVQKLVASLLFAFGKKAIEFLIAKKEVLSNIRQDFLMNMKIAAAALMNNEYCFPLSQRWGLKRQTSDDKVYTVKLRFCEEILWSTCFCFPKRMILKNISLFRIEHKKEWTSISHT